MATSTTAPSRPNCSPGCVLARGAIGRGELVVIPTDTVYGVAADAFRPEAVQRLLDAKGRGRDAPPPVLIPGIPTLDALAETVPDEVRALVAEFWPGRAHRHRARARDPSTWDLGETRGTVALRMPSDRIALELLAETGPLAVSSANLTGKPAATHGAEAARDARRLASPSTSTAARGGGDARRSRPGFDDRRRDGPRTCPRASCASCATASSPTTEIVRVVGAERCA